MPSIVNCRTCDKPIMLYTARLLAHPDAPRVFDKAVGKHDCPNGPARCPKCFGEVAATKNLPANLIGNVMHNHRRYCTAGVHK